MIRAKMIDKNFLNEKVIEYIKIIFEECKERCRKPETRDLNGAPSTALNKIDCVIKFSEYLYNCEHMTEEGDDEN